MKKGLQIQVLQYHDVWLLPSSNSPMPHHSAGMTTGKFYNRGVLMKDNKKPLLLKDLVPGAKFSALGQTFYITDADEFTRKYFK